MADLAIDQTGYGNDAGGMLLAMIAIRLCECLKVSNP